jgi:hypothetical protein
MSSERSFYVVRSPWKYDTFVGANIKPKAIMIACNYNNYSLSMISVVMEHSFTSKHSPTLIKTQFSCILQHGFSTFQNNSTLQASTG